MFAASQNYISQNSTSHRSSPRNTGVITLKITYTNIISTKSVGFIKNELLKLLSNMQTNLHCLYFTNWIVCLKFSIANSPVDLRFDKAEVFGVEIIK